MSETAPSAGDRARSAAPASDALRGGGRTSSLEFRGSSTARCASTTPTPSPPRITGGRAPNPAHRRDRPRSRVRSLDPAPRRHRLVPGRSHQTSTWPAPTAKAIPGCWRAPRGANADAGPPRWPWGSCSPVHPRASSGPTSTLRAGRDVPADGTIPYQRFRAWQVAGQTVGIVGYGGGGGRAAAWRFAGLGMKVISYDPFAPECDALASTTCWPRPMSCRCTRR